MRLIDEAPALVAAAIAKGWATPPVELLPRNCTANQMCVIKRKLRRADKRTPRVLNMDAKSIYNRNRMKEVRRKQKQNAQ